MNKFLPVAAFLLLIFTLPSALYSQYQHDIHRELEIPDILDIESSLTHFYVLSEREGLIVFRAHQDSLQYLYSSTGMQRRGNQLEADIRFAYLYGNGRRLTIIEPTSVLGVYSSTVLPEAPVSTRRIGNQLYFALEDGTLGAISLETPESVDTDPDIVDEERFDGRQVQNLATDRNRMLYVLSDGRDIDIYQYNSDESGLEHQEQVELTESIEKIFFTGDELIGTDEEGNIFLIDSDGEARFQASVESPVRKLGIWNDRFVVRTTGGELWIGRTGQELNRWKENESAGNFFSINKNRLLVSENNSVFPVINSNSENNASSGTSSETSASEFAIKPVKNITLPFPKSLIVPLEIEGDSYQAGDVTYNVESSIENIKVRGNSLYWQPSASETGRHQITVTATTQSGQSDQIQFTVELRPFNSPPRFTPARSVTIPVDEEFELEVQAFDPDGTHPELIRYLGVDLPTGASLNEQTGVFTWTPTIRQVGTTQFEVIATDQFGAASSQDFELRVVEVDEQEEVELESIIDSQ